jgi:hypothetical protein
MADEDEKNNQQDKDEELCLLYRSYSRVNTDFLKETLEAAKIPYVCHLKGGLLGRGSALGVGIFNPSNDDAIFYVPCIYMEEAEQIKIQVVGRD